MHFAEVGNPLYPTPLRTLSGGAVWLTKNCVAQCENIFLASKDSLDTKPIGVLSDAALRDVIKAIGHVIDSDCEPN